MSKIFHNISIPPSKTEIPNMIITISISKYDVKFMFSDAYLIDYVTLIYSSILIVFFQNYALRLF